LLIPAWAEPAWNEPEDFRGIKWKASPEEATSFIRDRWERRRKAGEIVLDTEIKQFYEDERVKRLAFRDKIGEVPVRLFFFFLDNQFIYVSIHFESNNYSAIKLAFKERYGPPHSERQFSTNETLNWGGSNIFIMLESGMITGGIATIGHKVYLEYITQREREKAKKGAKDL
jgi:hypothetical protein